MNAAPAGWYDDGSGLQRYWDGWQWGPVPTPPYPAQGYVPPRPQLPQPHATPAGSVPNAVPIAPAQGAPYPAQSNVLAHHAAVASHGVAPQPHPQWTSNGSAGQVPATRTNGVGVAGFVVGLVSVFLPLFLGVIGGLIGLVLSIVGLASHNPAVHGGRGLSIAGLVLSIVALILIL